jgi:hypothetical protein
MIPTDPPVLEVGSNDYVWGRFADRLKSDVSTVGIELQVIAPDGTPGAWASPDLTDETEASSGVLRAAVKFSAVTPGEYRLRGRLTDTPTVTVLTCGIFRVA